MKTRCQSCDLLDTRKKLQIPGTSSTIQPDNYNCDSCNIVYILMCSICDSGDNIGETSNIIGLRLNNHKKSIGDQGRCFLMAVHFNLPDHSLKFFRCVILRGDLKTTTERLICEQTFIIIISYRPTIVSTNKSVIKEWKLYNNIHSAKHLYCNSPECAYRQLSNHKRMLIKSNLSRIATLVGSSKCMKTRCKVCDMIDTRKKLQIPGTSSTIQPENYNCDSCSIVYLLMCDKCDSGNDIGDTSNRLRLRLNNHKKSIRDISRGFPEAVHFSQLDHSLKNLRCVIVRGDIKTTADRLICEQTLIHKFKTHSKCVNQDLSFLSPYGYFHQCCRPLNSTSVNNTEV